MKKMLRKILALSLIFVLICLCQVSAVTVSDVETEDYDERYLVTANYSLSQKSTGGTILVTDQGSMFRSPYLYVSVTYNYIKMVGINPVVITDTQTDTKTNEYSASVSFSDTTMREMVNATYTYAADIPCSYGTQRFQTRELTLTYPTD